ncbi:ABC transporter permease subunit [Catellatospora sichuanensis]|uniref:ABC transporter permease subunit n=1 Tax=Catellatospora sichuanensis TaxID=1969805 RepID=UPI001183C4D3|nr:ABC transporter permease subunit [Catellatospora sichuanensis]
MNLVRAEVSRLLSRRFTHIMVIGLLAVFGITAATTLASSTRPGSDAWVAAEQTAAERRTSLIQFKANCEAAFRQDKEAAEAAFAGGCDAAGDPADVRPEHFLEDAFVFEQEIRGLTIFLAVYLSFFAFVIAASFIGAEMSSGGITNLLLWRPQRSSLLGAKLAALTGCVVLFSTLFTVLYVGAFYLIAYTSGWTGDTGAAFWGELLALSWRGIALSTAAAACAFALATLARHTAAALGIAVGYFLVWEAGARIVFEIGGMLPYDPYFLSSYLSAFVGGDLKYWSGLDGSGDLVITRLSGGMVVAGLTAALLAAAFANFRRRDLT